MPAAKTRILIADDHEQMCKLVAELISLDETFEVMATASDGQGAIDAVANDRPDVVVLDRTMPGVSGLEACKLLRSENPASRVVMMSAYDHPAYAVEAFEAGAIGYVLKTQLARDLVPAIHQAMAGQKYLSKELSDEG